MIPDSDLKLWRDLSEKATAGPWRQDPNDTSYVRWDWQTICGCNLSHHDAAFIAAARDAVPRLIAEVERYQRACLQLRSEREQVAKFGTKVEADRDRLRGLCEEACKIATHALTHDPVDVAFGHSQIAAIRAELGGKP